MGIYSKLELNFDTNRFGDAQTLSSSASNTLNLIAQTTGPLKQWQQDALSEGSFNMSEFLQNPTVTYTTGMLSSANTIFVTANLIGDNATTSITQNLMVSISEFRSHTDNICGISVVSDSYFPTLQSAHSIGQLNMITLSRSEGVTNTAPILGSFTSLFVNDILESNNGVLIEYANQYENSLVQSTGTDPLTGNTITVYTSNLANSIISDMCLYMASTKAVLDMRRTNDVNFYQNSLQMAKNVGSIQQFDNMGGTMNYLVNNVIGTPSLITLLNSP